MYNLIMPKKLNQNEVQIRIDKKQEGQYELLGIYKNKDTPVLIKCRNCGIEWECNPNTLFRNRVGRDCKHHIKLTPEMAKKRISEKSNSQIKMIGEFVGSRTPTRMQCQICKLEWKTEPFVIYGMGFGCPNCSGKRKKDTLEFKQQVKNIVGDEYEVLGEYKNNKSKILFKHKKCGTKFYMTPHAFLAGQRCTNPKEIIDRRTKHFTMTLEKAKNILLKSRHGEYAIVGDFKMASKKATFKHMKCGKTFYSKVSPVLNNTSGCPYCYASHGEDAVKNFLIENNLDFKEQYRIKECKNKRPLPFDFAVFHNSSLLCLIEYQGIQHYKPKFGIKNFEETKMRDSIKYNYCRDNGIQLIRIPYKRFYIYEGLKEFVYSYLKKYITC